MRACVSCAFSAARVPMNATASAARCLPGKGRDMTEPMKLLTIQDVAELLHYSVKTVYKKAARGEIPSVPISPRKRLFSLDAIQYWLVNRQMGKL